MEMPSNKPKAIVFAHPFEGRTSYFLAGLSHFYELIIYYNASKRFRFSFQVFYKWQYAGDVKFIKCNSPDEVLDAEGSFDAAFVFVESMFEHLKWFEGQAEITEFVKKLKKRVGKLVWMEIGEHQWFMVPEDPFWETVDYVVKGQVFRPEYEHLMHDLSRIHLFQGKLPEEHQRLKVGNLKFEMGKWRHKILPLPFTPCITEQKSLDWPGVDRIYDFSGNTRTFGNGLLRYDVIKAIKEGLENEFRYSFEFDPIGQVTNLSEDKKPNDIYLKPYIGKLLFKLKYGRFFYPQPLYVHNLSKTRVYLGLGFTFSSLRTADVWGSGSVLVNFSLAKCDYGIPVEEGKHYISIGERDEMTDDNVVFKKEYSEQVVEKVRDILKDRDRQNEIIGNQYKLYREYFSSPEQFVKKIFIEKI